MTTTASGPGEPPGPSALRTVPGRVSVISCAALLLLWLGQQVVELPPSLQLLRKGAALTLIASGAWTVALLIARNRRRLLWRVRRKLLLSYLFLSVVPIVLVLTFALAGAVVLYDTLAAYLLRQSIDDVVGEVKSIGVPAAAEIGRHPGAARALIATRYQDWAPQFPSLSLAVVPAAGGAPLQAGPWTHVTPPRSVPAWLARARHFDGLVLASPVESATGGEAVVAVRCAEMTDDGEHLVVVDLPVGRDLLTRIDDRTGVRVVGTTVAPIGSDVSSSSSRANGPGVLPPASSSPFQETVAFVDVTDWETGRTQEAAVRVQAPLGRLSQRMAAVQSARLGSNVKGLVVFLLVLAVLFAIVQGSALVMGGALARSITYAVHELFVGTERVRQGDFTHRIRIDSQDQLGDLADSFNRMSASIEHLLHVQREKQRLDDELRIAREIQKSLLPVRPPAIPGLALADLCEPAREVGGDYYDFFELGPRRLGVLVADVSGKGTSAALYMAELKGLMLALSRTEMSPAAAAHRRESSPGGAPGQPQLHHDDLCGRRPRSR